MDAVILETDVLGPASQATYDDSLTSYQFPARYLRHFEALSRGAEMLAIIYEPRGKPPKGRMSYVGWGVLQGEPREDASGPGNAHRVDFVEPIRSFEQPVPREVDGEPVERWLRNHARGRERNTATRGRAVRGLTAEDAETILRLAEADVRWNAPEEDGGGPQFDGEARVRRTVTRLQRSARFREDVLSAYGWRCAVSGLSADGIDGLVEAAHIRGAGQPESGPDRIANGIALTPTLHRLFDRHLFSFRYKNDELSVVTSPQLTTKMLQDSISGSRLGLYEGQRVQLPSDPASRPALEFVDFHRRRLRRDATT